MKKSKSIAFSGVMSALIFVIISIGTFVGVLAYVAPIIAGIVIISVYKNLSKKEAIVVYVTVSILTLLLMPDKECSLTYIFFFGYYPIIKENIEKLQKFVSLIIKLLIFNAGIIVSQLICFYVFGIPFDDIFGECGIAILLIMANVVFFLYDKMLNLAEVLYMKKLYRKIKRLLS